MALSKAILGAGTTLSHCATSSGTYVTIAEVFTVELPSVKTEQVKVTHYGSTSLFHEYISGFKDGGEVNFELNYYKTEHATLDGLQGVQPMFWKVTLPDGSTDQFPGFLDALGASIPNEDKITSKGTLKVTGAPTFTPAA